MSGNRQHPRQHQRSHRSLVGPVVAAVIGLSVIAVGAVLLRHSGSITDRSSAAALGHWVQSSSDPPPQSGSPQSGTQPSVSPLLSSTEQFPQSGPGTFSYATSLGPTLGTAGPIRRFRVAIETNIN